MTILNRLRPARATLVAVLGFAWAITFGALRDFVWADIRAGMIDLRGFSRATRLIILLGLLLIFSLAGLLLFGNVWRTQSTFDQPAYRAEHDRARQAGAAAAGAHHVYAPGTGVGVRPERAAAQPLARAGWDAHALRAGRPAANRFALPRGGLRHNAG